MVVVARRKRLQAICQPIDGRLVGRVIVVWEYYVEAAVELGGSEFAEVLAGERQADEVGSRTLEKEPVSKTVACSC